jgi:hypothetical protein
VGIKIADAKMGGRRKRRIPLWFHGCALPIFFFVLFMINIWSGLMPLFGALFGFLYFFYWKRGKSPDEFKNPITFIKKLKFSDIGPLLRGIIIGPFVAVGIFAPFRAFFLGIFWIFGGIKFYTKNFNPTGDSSFYLDAAYGICGTILGILAGSIIWVRGLRLKSQLSNLPTSTIRSAAIGLSELRGTVQPKEGEPREEEGTPGEVEVMQNKANGNVTPILLDSYHDYKGEMRGKTIRSRFYLEDDTGRILVDPRGVKFWDGKGNFLWSPIRSIYLEKHYSEEILPWRSSAMLLPGDSVYVIGNVEKNEDAPPDAVDSERLVIKPATGLEAASFFKRLLFGEKRRTKGTDIYDIFFLTDVTELNASELFTKGLKNVWIWMLIWVALSLTLTLLFRSGQSTP